MTKYQTLRPGLLVSLKTSVSGNVNYIPTDRKTTIKADGSEVTEIETTRVIADPLEYKKACEARDRAAAIIRSMCVKSNFGLLCPEKAKEELDVAIRDAHAVVDDFNRDAAITRASVFIIVGQIASDDVEAVRAINSEVSGLMGQMEQGLKNLDVKMIRDAATKAKQIGQMLAPDAAVRVQMAVNAVRASAINIVKAGETAAVEIDLRAIRTVADMRTAFLDLGEAQDVAAPKHTGRALDLDPSVNEAPVVTKARQIEL
jgi:hypothetical protein